MSVATTVAAMTMLVMAAAMAVIVLAVAITVTVVVVARAMAIAMAMVVVAAAVAMIFVAATMKIAGSMVAGASREHATAGTRRACPVHNLRFHKKQRANGDGETKKERRDQTPVRRILVWRQMQSRIVIHHRRKNERDEIHDNSANRRCDKCAPIRNAPRPIQRDHHCEH